MKNKSHFYKYSTFLLLIVLIMTVIGLETEFEIITYIITFCLVSAAISLLYFKRDNISKGLIFLLIIGSFFVTYILLVTIIMIETNWAYSKISTIPKDSLREFYKTHNIDLIPPDKRHTWIGLFYKEIDVIPPNENINTKEVGWKGYNIFAYFNIEDDVYFASYH